MNVKDQIKEYIISQPEPKRSEMQALHHIILQVMPACKLWFLDGKDNRYQMPYFLSELKRTGVTRLLLWEEYRKESIDPFRYTQFCILLKQAAKITNASMHLVSCGRYGNG